MQTQVKEALIKGPTKTDKKVLSVQLPVQAYCEVPVPGFKGATMGACFVKVTDLPLELENFMDVNPRAPKRSASGSLQGPVVKDIMQTLREEPQEMALRNRGLFILADDVNFFSGGLKFRLDDKGRHGVCDGGHTMACIFDARRSAETPEEKATLDEAFVKIHIVQGLKADQVVEIASGLNTSRAVDEVSLMNLQGEFDSIRRSLRGSKASDSISYMQGDVGDVYISELLVYLAALDGERFSGAAQPASLYNRKRLAINYFAEDRRERPENLQSRIALLPDILQLVDDIRLAIPEAAKRLHFKMGMAIVGQERLGSKSQRGKVLPFTGRVANHKIPAAWLMPILSSFRVALRMGRDGTLKWKADPRTILQETITEQVSIIIAAHKQAGGHADKVGKSEATYSACASRVELWLASRRA